MLPLVWGIVAGVSLYWVSYYQYQFDQENRKRVASGREPWDVNDIPQPDPFGLGAVAVYVGFGGLLMAQPVPAGKVAGFAIVTPGPGYVAAYTAGVAIGDVLGY